MSALLQEVDWDIENVFGQSIPKGKIPIFGEFVINPELAPILVSGSTSPLWYDRVIKKTVRTVIRRDGYDRFPQQIIDAVASRGRRDRWGNLFTLDVKGIQSAVAHVRSYDIEDVVLISHEKHRDFLEGKVPDLELEFGDWIDEDCMVVVPKDRSFLGWVAFLNGTDGYFTSVVHNPSRGMAIVRGRVDAEMVGEDAEGLPPR